MRLTEEERLLAQGDGGEAVGMAMRIVTETAKLLGANELVPIASAHIDGCLYHGDGGVFFAEKLVDGKAKVRVPTTLNVGAMDLLKPERIKGTAHQREMAVRQMKSYEQMGCRPTWTCAPYQAGHRPELGQHVAWGESNAVAFCNSVLGARTNRYGDFLDICCAITGRAPLSGLHLDRNRRATVLIDISSISERLRRHDVFYPVLGSWLGRETGNAVAVIDGVPNTVTEDQLKALGAAAASTGAVGLFHVAGVTPEAATVEDALHHEEPESTIVLTTEAVLQTRDGLSTVGEERVDVVVLGSPHFSIQEFDQLEQALAGAKTEIPIHVCTGRGVLQRLEQEGRADLLREAGVEIIVDTCVVVAPILKTPGGVLMTNSGKFAHYGPGTIGYDVVYGSLEDCVMTAKTGKVTRERTLWS